MEQQQTDPQQQVQAENQKLKMVLENLAVKLARREVYISELETDNQIMFNQIQQLQQHTHSANAPEGAEVAHLHAVPDPDDAE